MNRSTFTVTVLLLLTLLTAACKPEEPVSQNTGLATLARHVEGYAQAKPGQPLVFPQDHGSHPDFRIEWWYLTANLQDPSYFCDITHLNHLGRKQWTVRLAEFIRGLGD